MAYLHWSKSEDDRIEAQVALMTRGNSLETGRGGIGDIWRRVEQDQQCSVPLLTKEKEHLTRYLAYPSKKNH